MFAVRHVLRLSVIGVVILLSQQFPAHAAVDASSNVNRGKQAFKEGKYKLALDTWIKAENSARDTNDTGKLLELLWLESEAYRALGQHDSAIFTLAEAIGISENVSSNETLLASIYSSYGDSLTSVGRWTTAVRSLKRAVKLSKKSGNKALLAISLNNLGNVHYKRGSFISAAEAYLECNDVASTIGNDLLVAQSSLNLTKIFIQQGEVDSANTMLDAAIESLKPVKKSKARLKSLIAIGKSALDLSSMDSANRNKWDRHAYNHLSDARLMATSFNDTRSLSYITGYLGKAYSASKRHDEALTLYNEAIGYADKSSSPEAEYIWHWDSARIHKEQNNIDAAIAAYRLAVEKLQLIRHKLPKRTAFKEILGPVFFELTDLLLQKPNSLAKKSDGEAYLLEARTTMELLKTAEMQDYFQDNCVTSLQSRTQSLDAVQDNTAILYPILLKDRMEILLSFQGGMDKAVVNISEDELSKTVFTFRNLLVNLDNNDYLAYSQKLYDHIIRPMQPILESKGIKTLVIVPDSALRTIPMAALHDGKEFLISKYAIAVTPGLTLTDARPLKRDKLDVLVGGLTDGVQGFSPLPNVALEVENIKKDFSNSTILMNKDYSVPGVETELTKTNFNIVHIASHAQFSSDPNETFLLSHEGKFSMDKLETIMGRTKFRDEPVELIALSACQTAAGDERAALGLAGIAIKAGARSALATLWFINDKASSLLVSDFYKQLKKPGVSKAQALQQAQINIMSQDQYQHPLFWSPFLLIGNWL